jgi:serine/threonine-protein kinase
MEDDRSIGSSFAGYRLDRLLGRGGMGTVYLATQEESGRMVALKLLRLDLASDVSFSARFKREARLGTELRHPHVVPLVGAGESQGVLYLAMDYIDGVDLAHVIAFQGPLHPRVIAAVVAQLGAALDAAAELGLVHRDVKPANVLIESRDGDPYAYLTDLGVSKHVTSQSGLTAAGVWVGSIDYASPEQLQSQPVDARTDVYALGCLLYEGLTGEVPFPRTRDVDKMMAHLAEPPPRPSLARPETPASFDAVVATALSKLPQDRFATAGALARAAVAAGADAGPAPSPPLALPVRPAQPIDRDAPTVA